MAADNSEHATKGSLNPEDSTKYSTENSGNHGEALLSRVESSLANQAVRDSERGVQQIPENKENTHTVAELLEILKRGGDSSYQLTSHATHQLIDAGYGVYVTLYLNHFTGLDANVAHKLIDTGNGGYVAKYLNHFTGLNHNEIAHQLINAGHDWSVAEHLNHFTGLDARVAHKLINAGL